MSVTTLNPGFWDRVAQKYAASPVRNMKAYEHTLDRTRAWLPEGADVLELGCGTGTTALKLAGDVGRLTATDFSPQMIAIAQAKPNPTGRVKFLTATAETAPQGPFDAVLAFSFLHLVPDLPGTLAAAHARLKPGGVLISKTGCVRYGNPFIPLMIKAMQLIGKAPFVQMLSTEDIEAQITQAGFEIVETGTFNKGLPARFVVAKKV